MRTLSPAPERVCSSGGALSVGSFRGSLPAVDLSPLGKGKLHRLAHHKRWVYLAIATDEVFVAAAVVNLGYIGSGFAFAIDRTQRGMLVDTSILAPPVLCTVSDAVAPACQARISLLGDRIELTREAGEQEYTLRIELPKLSVYARVEAPADPPAISAVASLGGGLGSATEKRALLPVRGGATIGGRHVSLAGGVAGYDYTHGYLRRHTAWRWAFAMGRAESGERVAFNLVQGFMADAECAVWVDDAIYPVGEATIISDANAPERPWRVTTSCGALELEFEPTGVHAEHKNLGLVRSRFIQPAGTFTGTLRLPGREPMELREVFGVTEDQDVVW